VGYGAGETTQGLRAVAMGYFAGETEQGASSVAVGVNAGETSQGGSSVAIGDSVARYNQGSFSTAVGSATGQAGQGTNATAVGRLAGQTSQGDSATAVGLFAGQSNQGSSAVAVGHLAGQSNQNAQCIAMGIGTGQYNQAFRGIAIGAYAGGNTQGDSSIAIGRETASVSQSYNSIAIGRTAGYSAQGPNTIAIGYDAGRVSQTDSSVAVGVSAGSNNQGSLSVAMGRVAGYSNQGIQCVAVGEWAGTYNQGNHSVAVGSNSGGSTQASDSVAVGYYAGHQNQGTVCVAVGPSAGRIGQRYFAAAFGVNAGYSNQGHAATAIGNNAGTYNQGQKCVALGPSAGETSQPAFSFYLRSGGEGVRDGNGSEYLHYNNNNGEVSRGNNYSDDRLKYNEEFITGAIKTLFKIRPQIYDKKPTLEDSHSGQQWKRESGVIAQEVFYSAPELRHLVQIPLEAGDVEKYTPAPSDDPTQDPDYSVWGPKSPAVKYEQFVPYLVKAVQEIVTELPRSKTTVSNTWGQNITGLVVSANANAHKTNTTPIVALSNVYMDKKWYGVVSEKKTDTNDYDTLVDTKGDTRVWVTDVGGPLESGDLVTTSNVAPGYTQKQGDGVLMNYTVAKVTQDCDFTEPVQRPIRVPRRELSNVTYYTRTTTNQITLFAYEKINDLNKYKVEKSVYFREYAENNPEVNAIRYYKGELEVGETTYDNTPENERTVKYFKHLTPDEYNDLDDTEKVNFTAGTAYTYHEILITKSKTQVPEHDEQVVVEELVDVLDENGQIVWEDTDETEPVYTLVDHGSYKAALVSAKLI
jgi:hypothetical protein